MSRPTRRGPAGGPGLVSATITTTGDQTASRQDLSALAVDARDLLDEVQRILDAADIVAMDALAGGEFTPIEACEHNLVMHGKMRRLLGAVLVGVSS